MWEMVLAFIKAYPSAWGHVNLHKAVLPRLCALLRHGCYGAAAGSLPALLPLLAALPLSALQVPGGAPAQLLEATWQGLPHCGTSAGRAAVVSAYQECLVWLLRSSARLAAPEQQQQVSGDGGAVSSAAGGAAVREYCAALLAAGFLRCVLPAAFAPGADGELALSVVSGVAAALLASSGDTGGSSAGSGAAAALPEYFSAVGLGGADALREALASAAPAAVYDRCQQLLGALASGSGATAAASAGLAAHWAPPLASAIQQGVQLPPAASSLLSQLIKEHGPSIAQAGGAGTPAAAGALPAGAAAGSAALAAGGAAAAAQPDVAAPAAGGFSLAALVASCLEGASGAAADAQADLLLTCLQSSATPEAAWEEALQRLTGEASGWGCLRACCSGFPRSLCDAICSATCLSAAWLPPHPPCSLYRQACACLPQRN